MNEIFPCLWFNGQAVEAAELYVSVFPNSKILQTTYYGEGMMQPAGNVLTVTLDLNGRQVMILNGGAHFTLSPAVSLVVPCDSQEELDRMWDALLDGGQASQCGWLEDKYGVSWNVVPTVPTEMLADADAKKAERVTKAFGPVVAVRDVSFEIEPGALVTLLGPSGCGKTTTLRLIAGLERPTSGRIRIGDDDVTTLPATERDVSMVFQSYALFPHMTVLENVAYGLSVSGWRKAEAHGRAEEGLAARTAGAFAEAVDRFRDGLRTARDTGARAPRREASAPASWRASTPAMRSASASRPSFWRACWRRGGRTSTPRRSSPAAP